MRRKKAFQNFVPKSWMKNVNKRQYSTSRTLNVFCVADRNLSWGETRVSLFFRHHLVPPDKRWLRRLIQIRMHGVVLLNPSLWIRVHSTWLLLHHGLWVGVVASHLLNLALRIRVPSTVLLLDVSLTIRVATSPLLNPLLGVDVGASSWAVLLHASLHVGVSAAKLLHTRLPVGVRATALLLHCRLFVRVAAAHLLDLRLRVDVAPSALLDRALDVRVRRVGVA